MSDKTRAEFEQEFPPPDGVFWNGAFEGYDELRTNTGDAYYARYEAWQAAKEKYGPRWIAVSERLPAVAQEVIVFSEFDGVCAAVLDSFSEWFAPCSDYKIIIITHWMPLPSAPSTQGGGE